MSDMIQLQEEAREVAEKPAFEFIDLNGTELLAKEGDEKHLNAMTGFLLDEVFRRYDETSTEASPTLSNNAELNKRHVVTVIETGDKIINRLLENGIKVSWETRVLARVGEALHDLQKQNPERKTGTDKLLFHPQDSARDAREILLNLGFPASTITHLQKSIIAHGGMPFVENVLNSNIKQVAEGRDDEVELPANSIDPLSPFTNFIDVVDPKTGEVTQEARYTYKRPETMDAAILYMADFLAVASLDAKQTGGFDKLFSHHAKGYFRVMDQAEIDAGRATCTLDAGFKSAWHSLERNVSAIAKLEIEGVAVGKVIAETEGAEKLKFISGLYEYLNTPKEERDWANLKELEAKYTHEGNIDVDGVLAELYGSINYWKLYSKN